MAQKDLAPHQVPQITDEDRQRQAKLEAEIRAFAERILFIESRPWSMPMSGRPFRTGTKTIQLRS